MRVPERLIQRAGLHKLRLRAHGFNAAAVYHGDLVGVDDGGKPVCNDDQRFAAHKLRHALLNERLVFRIGVGGRLVQENDGRVLSIARAMEMRCISPPERCPPPLPTCVSKPFSSPMIALHTVRRPQLLFFHTAGGWFAAASTKKSVRPI